MTGLRSYDRLAAAGIPYRSMGENLGWGKGYPTPTDVVRVNHEMMVAEKPPDDGHRQIILSPDYHKVGIGVAQAADGKVYYVAEYTD